MLWTYKYGLQQLRTRTMYCVYSQQKACLSVVMCWATRSLTLLMSAWPRERSR